MIKSFNSWKEISEALVNGLTDLPSPTGEQKKISWDVKDSSTFIIKVIDSTDLVNENGNLTDSGWNSLKSVLNAQPTFTTAIGGKLESFIPAKVIVYAITSEKDQTSGLTYNKVLFKLVDRPETIDSKLQIVSNTTYGQLVNTPEAVTLANKLINDVRATNTTSTPGLNNAVPVKSTVSAASSSTEDGKFFRYTMRTNETTYKLEYDSEDNVIVADAEDGDDKDGTIEYSNGNVIFHPETEGSAQINITNSQDKQFFTDVFTKPEYRTSLAKEQKEEYGDTEVTADNITSFLYDRSENPIFGSSTTPSLSNAETDDTPMTINKLGSMISGLTQPTK